MAAGQKAGALVLAGGIVGGIAGFFAFRWMLTQGFYGLVVPGGMVGLGAGMFRSHSRTVPIVCGVLALGAGLFSEWWTAPFIVDDSLGYFLTHLHRLRSITLIDVAIGTLLGFYVPFRRRL